MYTKKHKRGLHETFRFIRKSQLLFRNGLNELISKVKIQFKNKKKTYYFKLIRLTIVQTSATNYTNMQKF